jgi:hypothetical protein
VREGGGGRARRHGRHLRPHAALPRHVMTIENSRWSKNRHRGREMDK